MINISAADYLDRGSQHSGLWGKLQSYLKSQYEDIEDYPYIYLVTAPRFLGYSFNPVSFWYLYNKKMELVAMILEVNNTFDERRIYFLKGATPPIEQNEEETSATNPSRKFKHSWIKDFHVSPFNSRKGSYALSAQDPILTQFDDAIKIDNTITLSSSKAHAKLVARIFSTQPSIDPTTLGYWGRFRFIASWWWVGFVTFPRIVKEAGKLFFRKRLHVWFRPEVLRESIGRRATEDEIIIERTFRSLLRSLVEASNLGSSIKYISPVHSSPSSNEETFHPKSSTLSAPPQHDPIVLNITTPLFYARLAHDSHISAYLSHEILTDDAKNRTFYISHPQPFLRLFDERSTDDISTRTSDTSPKQLHTSTLTEQLNHERYSTYDRLAWRFLHWLCNHRRRPLSPQQGQKQQQQQQQRYANQIDIRQLGFSHLDRFAMSRGSREQAVRYRTVVTKMLLADILAFGYPEVFDAAGYVLKVLCSYLFVAAVKLFWGWVLV
ncbi:MAG: hypothetical protein Q9216_002544 [Gyalolechia sp. 2 TL-2023]